MATPNRLKSDASKPNPLAVVLAPLIKIARVITPTGIGVLLSVGAHAALITAGPRIDLSFDELTKENLEANPEETIVPILQLSAEERNRLPSFAQPRRPPTSTGLSSLQLPSGLPSFPSSRNIKRRSVPSQPIPSPNLSKPKPIGQALPNNPTTSFKLDFPIRNPGISTPAPSTGTPYIPSTPAPPIPADSINSGEGARPITFDENGLPILNSGAPNNSDAIAANGGNTEESSSNPNSTQSGGTSLSDVLAGTQGVGVTEETARSDEGGEPSGEAGEIINIENTPGQIASAPAEGDSSALLKGSNVYSNVGVSDAEAQENLNDWLKSTAAGQTQVETAESEITIDSGFKACREVAPVNGLIGVVVNPDGTQSSAEMLKSTGYGTLNSLALSTLEYEEFEQPAVPTQYQVEVKVVYEPQDCVEELPDAPDE